MRSTVCSVPQTMFEGRFKLEQTESASKSSLTDRKLRGRIQFTKTRNTCSLIYDHSDCKRTSRLSNRLLRSSPLPSTAPQYTIVSKFKNFAKKTFLNQTTYPNQEPRLRKMKEKKSQLRAKKASSSN